MADTYPDKISSAAEAVHLPLPKFQFFTCRKDKFSSYSWDSMDPHVLAHAESVKVENVDACGQPFLSNSGGEHLCNDPKGHNINKRHNVRRHQCGLDGHRCYEADRAPEIAMNKALLETIAAYKKKPSGSGRQGAGILGPKIRAAWLKAAPGVGR